MLNDQHIMIDIETTDVKPNSGIFQISAIAFVPSDLCASMAGRLLADLYLATPQHIDLLIQPLSFIGRSEFSVNHSTCNFICKNNKAIFIEALAVGMDFKPALSKFLDWVREIQPKHIWAKDPSFDLTILRHACSVFQVDSSALDFRAERSIRTVQELIELHQLPEFCTGKLDGAHNARVDCTLQLNTVLRYLNWKPIVV